MPFLADEDPRAPLPGMPGAPASPPDTIEGDIARTPAPPPDAGFFDSLAPAFRTENTAGAALSREEGLPSPFRRLDPDFDPFAEIDGYEDFAPRFAFANTSEEVAAEKRQIDHEIADRRVVDSAGLSGVAATFVAGALDPVNLIPVGGTAYRTYRGGGSILEGGLATMRAGLLGTTAMEAGLQASEETRTLGESAMNVGVGTFLAGVLGAGGAALAGRGARAGAGAFKDLAARVEKDLTVPPDDVPDPVVPGFRKVPEAELEADARGAVAPAAPAAAAAAGAAPSNLVELSGDALKAVQTDAKRFQFKEGGDEAGVTDRLRGVKQWDQRLAGVTLVWEDNAGGRFIVDGHQRLNLAKRATEAGQPDVKLNAFVLREGDGITPEQAMVVAAVKNIAEGTGSPVDAAKVLRLVERNPELAKAAGGLPPLPPSSALVRDAGALAKLGDEPFGMVVNGVVPPRYAAHVGRAIVDPQEQRAALDVLAKTAPRNVDEARHVVDQVRAAGFAKAEQGGLFGEDAIAESLFGERARLLDLAEKKLRTDRRIFRTLVDKAGTIAEAGNRLAADANQARLSDDEILSEVLSKLATRKGSVSDALERAARELKGGARPGPLVERLVGDVRRAVREGVDLGPAPGGAGPAGEGSGAAAGRVAAAAAEPAPAVSANADPLSPEFLRQAAATGIDRARATGRAPAAETPEAVIGALDKDLREAAAQPQTALIDTPERHALRKNVLETLMRQGGRAEGPAIGPRRERIIHIVLGPPAAGKSTALVEPLLKRTGAMLIDADEAKKLFPEYEGGRGSSALQRETSELVEGDLLERAGMIGANIVLPKIGRDLKSLEGILTSFKAADYRVFLHLSEVPPQVSIERAVIRYTTERRAIPLDYLASIGEQPRATFDALKDRKDLIDGSSSWDNAVPYGQGPKLVNASGVAEGDVRAIREGLGRDDAQIGAADRGGVQGQEGPGGRVNAGTEKTPEGDQFVLPGAEKISDTALLERQADTKLTADVAQQPPDGLFDTGARAQTDILDHLTAADPNAKRGSVGAAAFRDTTLAEEGLKSALGLEKGLGFSDPLLRAATSPAIATRRVMQELAETPLTYEKNRHGIPTAPGGAVETRIKLWQAPLAEALQAMDDAFVRYRLGRSKRFGDVARLGVADLLRAGKPADRLGYTAFKEEIAKAMRRGDRHPIGEVAEAARAWREKVFDPLKERAIELELLPEDVGTETAVSYLTRLYNTEKIAAQRPGFTAAVTRWLAERRAADEAKIPELERELARAEAADAARAAETAQGGRTVGQKRRPGGPLALDTAEPKRAAAEIEADLERARRHAGYEDLELVDIAEQITDRILSTPDGRLPYDGMAMPEPRGRGGRPRHDVRGPLKGRTFLIPDERIEEFLDNDVEVLGRVYTRTMAADTELTARFGDVAMTSKLDDIRREYADLARGAGSEAERVKIFNRRNADMRDVAAVRDRLRGTYALPRDPNAVVSRAARVVKNLNYLRLLGGMTTSSLPDPFRIAMVNGLGRFVGDGLAPMVRNMGAYKLAAAEVKRAGTALDMVLDSRAMAIADVMDDYGRHSRFERTVHSLSHTFGVVSAMAPWNAFWKQMAGVVTMSRIVDAAEASAAGTVSARTLERLAAAGIDGDMARRIADQFAAHGEDAGDGVGRVRLANTLDWDDADAVTAFRAAVARDVDRTIVTPGQDKPLWMSTQLGGVVGQFKSFQVASTQRILLAGLQDRDASALAGFTLMVGAGMAVYALKTWEAGKDLSNEPGAWLVEGIDRAGVTGWFFEPHNMIEKATRGTIGLKNLLGAKQPMSRYASRNITDALLGPTFGLVEDAIRVAGAAVATPASDQEWKRSDTRAVRRLLPYQNLVGFRVLVDHLEQGINDSLGVPER